MKKTKICYCPKIAKWTSRSKMPLELSSWDIEVDVFHKLCDHCRAQKANGWRRLIDYSWAARWPSLFHIRLIDGMLCWLRIKKQWVNIGCHYSNCTWFRRSFQIVTALSREISILHHFAPAEKKAACHVALQIAAPVSSQIKLPASLVVLVNTLFYAKCIYELIYHVQRHYMTGIANYVNRNRRQSLLWC